MAARWYVVNVYSGSEKKVAESIREQAILKKMEEEVEKHAVRIAEAMKEHEHGILETTTDKILIDFVTKTSKRPDSKALKERYPTVYTDVIKTTESRKLKVSVHAI